MGDRQRPEAAASAAEAAGGGEERGKGSRGSRGSEGLAVTTSQTLKLLSNATISEELASLPAEEVARRASQVAKRRPEWTGGSLEEPLLTGTRGKAGSPWLGTLITLISLQLGWGLWIFPANFARLGYLPAVATTLALAAATAYSGRLFARLHAAVPSAVLFGDVGHAVFGAKGRTLVYTVVYSLDATRCIILHLAATQALCRAASVPSMPLWGWGLIVAGITAVVAQVRALASLSWFLTAGTACQLVSLGLVGGLLVARPDPAATTELVHAGDWAPGMVAVMNIIFAFGGQFAYLEIINAMERPRRFPSAVSVSAPLMAVVYLVLGVVGYRSRGTHAPEVIIFGMGGGPLSRAAAGAILFQALAQYLVNLNVWAHNILTLLARRSARQTASACHIRTACDHRALPWALTTLAVIAYSCAVAVSLPFFSTLVGLMTSATYLVCAYALPCWFLLKLAGRELAPLERWACRALIPLSLALSAAGFAASVIALVGNLGGGPL